MSIPLKYNFRNLFRRKMRTILTVFGIALVVSVAIFMMAYSRGLIYSVRNNGDPENVIFLSKKGVQREFSSFKTNEFELLLGMIVDDVAKYQPPAEETEAPDPLDEEEEEDDMFEDDIADMAVDLLAGYLMYTAQIEIKGFAAGPGGGGMQAMILGVEPLVAFRMNNKYKLTGGGEIEVGTDENVAMVGSMVHARLGVDPEDVAVGKTFIFRNVEWKIIGTFEASGTSADSEIWVPLRRLQTVLNRPELSYGVAKLKDKDRVEGVAGLVNESEQVQLRAVGEREFYKMATGSFKIFATIGVIMAMIITVGGIMAGMNTMYTAVTGRTREIGMLQVLGFSKRSILFSFVFESIVIALVGGIIGCGVGYLVNGMPMKVTMGAFKFRVDSLVLGGAILFAFLIGLVGAVIPAVRAVRLRAVDAMRYM